MPPVRNPRNRPLKGALLPSFLEPPAASSKFKPHPDRALPKGQSWVAHSGRGARLRNLKNLCLKIIRSKDPEIQAALGRIREALKDDPEPEYGFLNILNAARMAHEDVDVSLPESIDYMLNKWADAARVGDESERPEAAGV